MALLPTGLVTFLFTDIEGSTQRWERTPDAMRLALICHDALLEDAILAHHGAIFKRVGDAFCAAFAAADRALAAALAIQRAIAAATWTDVEVLRVRIALHSGTSDERNADYFGPTVNRVARLLAAGHGGQILVSHMTQTLVGDALPPEVSLRDLGIRRLKDLAAPEHIWQVVAPDLPATFPPLKTLDVRPSNLPIQLLPLLGRPAEVTQAEASLIHDRARILTLTGPGGIGKTRLAQELGHMLQDRYPDGVVMVDLAPVTDPALVLPTLAQTLGVPAAGDHPLVARLHAYLHDLRLLLILDNLEHLLVVVPEIMALIQSTRHVQILVTSREPLQVRGEVLLVLPPLPVPAAAPSLSVEEALTLPVVRLFCDRAQAAVPTFQLTATELPAVLDLCRRLDGVPLAIELTAAGIRIMSPTNLVARLDRGLDGLLHQGRDRPSRHQTLRQTITWSYDLLTPAEQRLFAHLAVFEGGWTVEAAEAVCADPTLPAPHILTLLDAVVMKNLVQRMPVEDSQEPRFQMLTTIRTYAEECLERQPERARIHQQHLQYYAALTDSQRGQYVGAAQITHLNRLEVEQHNLRAALAWAVTTGAGTTGLTLANALALFWTARGDLDEAQTWFALLLALPDAPPHLRMEALAHSAYLALLQGDAVVRRTTGAASLAIAQTLEDEEGLAHAWQVLTWDFFAQDPALAIHHLQAARAIWEQGENQAECAITLGILGYVYTALNEYRAATQAYTSSLQQWESLNDGWGRSDMLIQLGALALQHGDTERAAALLMTGLTQKRALRHHEGMAEALLMLSRLAWWQGDQAEAAAHESLRIYRMLGHRRGISGALGVLSDLALEAGHDLQAQRYLDESSALQAAMEYAPAIMLGTLRHAVLLMWRGQLSAAVACLTSLDVAHALPGIRCSWVETIALLAYRDAQFPSAARLWGWADQVRRSHELGVAMGPWRMQPAYRHTMDQHLGAGVVATTWAAGGSAPADAIIGEAYRVMRTIEAQAADG